MMYLLAAIYVFLSCSGLILFKLGSKSGAMGIEIISNVLNIKISLISILGIVCYISSFLLYLILVSKFELSKIYPITTGVIFIGVMLGSAIFLKESIHWQQVFGSGCILIGIIMLAFFSK